MTLKTRRPTGTAGWPMLLLAGIDKAGKTYQSVLASSSPDVGRTLLISFGELDPDEYSLIPGSDFEIVEHDGTYQGLLQAVRDAAAEPPTDGLPNLVVFDGGSALWELLQNMMQMRANLRARVKAEQAQRTGGRVQGPPPGSEDYQITSDLWNEARRLWLQVVHALRAHQGPVIITARLDEVMVMDARGNPTQDKQWKVQAHKSLPFDVDGTVQMRVRGQALVTGFRSLRFTPGDPEALVPFPDFTVPKLWERLGVTGAGAKVGRHSTTQPNAEASEQREQGNQLGAARTRLLEASRHVMPALSAEDRSVWVRGQIEDLSIADTDVQGLNDLADNWLRSDPWLSAPSVSQILTDDALARVENGPVPDGPNGEQAEPSEQPPTVTSEQAEEARRAREERTARERAAAQRRRAQAESGGD